MSVRIDATGNVVGRREGSAPNAPALLIGSHIDTVRDAGRFDGCLGVLTGIAVVAELAAKQVVHPFAIEVIAFGDEEGVRFTSALGGSRALAGTFDPAVLDERDEEGVSRRQALVAFGCNPDAIASEARSSATALGYVEVHIEQGPVLEAEDLSVGVVTAISGATRGIVEVTGEPGHAGTVPMLGRRDALAAAAEMVLAVEARAKGETDLVATVGRLALTNAAGNTIPGKVQFSLDVRAPVDAQRAAAVADIKAAIARIAAQRNVGAQVTLTYDAPATPCDARLMQLLSNGIEEHRPEGAPIAERRRTRCHGLPRPPAAGHAVRAVQGRHQPPPGGACLRGRHRRRGSRAALLHRLLDARARRALSRRPGQRWPIDLPTNWSDCLFPHQRLPAVGTSPDRIRAVS